ncbi:MAG: IS607 family transposase [Legionellales bacterium]|jgi:predicted site-specific integrase-resolvase
MNKFIKVGQAAQLLGVSVQTLRRWEERGELLPERRSEGGTRYYDIEKLLKLRSSEPELTIAYARASAPEESDFFKQQVQKLELYCAQKGWTYEVLRDRGSGINCDKSGLRKLLNLIVDKKIKRLVVTHKDRLLRIGAELVFALCAAKKIEVVILNSAEHTESDDQELLEDVIELVTIFSARMYHASKETNQKLIKAVELLTKA